MRMFSQVILILLALAAAPLTLAQAPTQLQLNDAAVLQDFCTLFEAERAYYDAQFPDEYWPAHGYAVDFADLINGSYLPLSWAMPDPLTRNGYVFVFEQVYPYQVTATPITLGITGSWDLYGDWTQTIHMGTDATGALFDYSPCDIAQDISTNEAKVIEDLYAIYVALQTNSLGHGYEVDFAGYQYYAPNPLYPLEVIPVIYGQWWDGDLRKHGYIFSYRGENNSGSPCPDCRYSAVAVPEQFGVTGNRAFYLDQSGIIRAENYRNAGPASPPILDTATYPPNLLPDLFRSEIQVINNYACQIHSAQVDYHAANSVYTAFFDDLTTFEPPYLEGSWEASVVEGYNYTLSDPSGSGEAYEVTVDPNVQGTSGNKGYFFDNSGVLRAIVGPGASASSPIVGNVCDEIIKLNPIPPAETPPALYHSGDIVQDYLFSLSEVLRIIQLFNVGSFSCDAGSEDGFAAGAGDTSCSPHSGDYATQDWSISMNELLRFIQIFNSYGYFPCPNAPEDNYCLIL